MIFWRIWWVAWVVLAFGISAAACVSAVFMYNQASDLRAKAELAREQSELEAKMVYLDLMGKASKLETAALGRLLSPFFGSTICGPLVYFSGAELWGW